jgi:glucokinase
MNSYPTAIGIDIGRYQITSAVIRSDGALLASQETAIDARQNRDSLVKAVTTAIRIMRSEAAGMRLNPVCAGVAAKGFINSTSGTIIGPDRGIDGWTDVPLARLLNRETSLPVYVDNDANLMTLAEFRLGAARGHKNVVFISLRTGIGGGIIIDGKLYRGVNNSGAEFGQMIIDFKGDRNKKGIPGTLESYASSQALVESFIRASLDDRPAQSIIQPESAPLTAQNLLKARDVFDLHYNGNKFATAAVMQNARYIGIGIANLTSLFSPEIVVLGGGMANAGDDYIGEIKRVALENTFEYYGSNLVITRAELGQSAAITGAALFALSRLSGKHV